MAAAGAGEHDKERYTMRKLGEAYAYVHTGLMVTSIFLQFAAGAAVIIVYVLGFLRLL